MAFQIYSQRDPRWAGHALGSGAGELGPYGCFETCFTMVYDDAYSASYTPDVMDNMLWADGVFSGDLLPDNALDRAFPGKFSTRTEGGFNQAEVNAAIASPDTYAIICIHNPAVGVPGYHFMVMYSPTQVADPWWGKVMSLGSWGGPGVVVKTVYVKSLRAQVEAEAAAAAAAKAAADKAAADAAAKAAAAKAQADAAAKALADAQAAAAAAQAAAAANAAAEDAREARAHAAADAAARAAVVAPGKATPPTAAPTLDFWGWLDVLILALLGKARG